jgi:hypothetical protein
MRRLRILTWHVHGSYLYYLSQIPHDLFVPVAEGRPDGYVGLPAGGFPWPDNLHEVPADELDRLSFDCLLFQSRPQWEVDRFRLLTHVQRRLPRIYLEHDPPRQHPTDTRHFVDDPDALLVHVTPFNQLMWDNGRTPTRVIDHGVMVPPGVTYSGEIDRAVAVVNNIRSRGRRLGSDLLDTVRADLPVDLFGLGSAAAGGLGEVPHRDLFAVVARYRAFFNPIRYTSLGLAVCEAMMLGLPIVGLATTEMATVIENGVSGYVGTDLGKMTDVLREVLQKPALARRMGEQARRYARQRFAIERFVGDWNEALSLVTGARAGARSIQPAFSPAEVRP